MCKVKPYADKCGNSCLPSSKYFLAINPAHIFVPILLEQELQIFQNILSPEVLPWK